VLVFHDCGLSYARLAVAGPVGSIGPGRHAKDSRRPDLRRSREPPGLADDSGGRRGSSLVAERGMDKSIVLGFKSRYLRAEVPNRYVADYVKKFPQKLIGFAGIDRPSGRHWMNCGRAGTDCSCAGSRFRRRIRILIRPTAGRCGFIRSRKKLGMRFCSIRSGLRRRRPSLNMAGRICWMRWRGIFRICGS